MRRAFEIAAFQAGCRAQRGGASHEENPFHHERLPDLARRWRRGWVTAIECPLDLNWVLHIEANEAYEILARVQQYCEAA